MGDLLLGATLATLLDLEIEPVAAHIERYWLWLTPRNINYYGVPLANFVAWFVVALLLLWLVNIIFSYFASEGSLVSVGAAEWMGGGLCGRSIRSATPPTGMNSAHLWALCFVSRYLFAANLFMFGLVDFRAFFAAVSRHVPVAGGKLGLGTWQGIYVAEHRARPHRREVTLQFLGSCGE